MSLWKKIIAGARQTEDEAELRRQAKVEAELRQLSKYTGVCDGCGGEYNVGSATTRTGKGFAITCPHCGIGVFT